MRVGYIRVSTVDQNTARQEDLDVEKTFLDKASGKDTARPKLDELIGFVREGDTVRVHSMDRLARNLDDLRRLVRTLTGKGVRVEFVKENLTFTGEDSPMATLLLSVMGAFAEFERSLILERQREGIAAAKARGAYTGRKPALTDTQAHQLRQRAAAGEKKAALAREFGISRETVYSYLNTGPALPADQRVRGEVGGVSSAVVHAEDEASKLDSSDVPVPTPAPVPPAAPAAAPAPGRWAGARVRQPKSRRERWLDPKAKVRELVTLIRDPDTGDHRVTDGDEYLGRIARQITATGRRGRWQALDPHNTVLRAGPWATVDEALTGLLTHHLEQQES